jgi:hypothetical protein
MKIMAKEYKYLSLSELCAYINLSKSTIYKKTSQTYYQYNVVDVGILTALLSLEEAVRMSKRQDEICAKAVYWAQLTKLLVNEITEGYEFELQEYLATAKTQIDASQMESLIYATAA